MMEGDPHQLHPLHPLHPGHRAHQIPGCLISSGEEMHEEEELDPRIQVELEKLNRATEEINRLELELDDARAAFRQVLSDSTQRLNGLAKKLGACVDKARPYYDARMKLKEAHLDSQKAALRFERACSMHEAAKEMVQLAEEGYKRRELDVDPTWQEMLNHATMKVNDAERERMESEDYHQRTTMNFKRKDEEVQKLQKDLKRAITKSKPYFEMKAKFNQVMEDHKRNVSRLEEDVCSTKALYSEALRSLEAISDDIHRQRLERRQKMQLGVREAGVGAESPSPPPSWIKGAEGSVTCTGFHTDGDTFSMSSLGHMDSMSRKNPGITGHEYPICHHSAVSENEKIKDGSFDPDPLNIVVFKTPTKESKLSAQLAASSHSSPSGSVCNDSSSSPSYKKSSDLGKEQGEGSYADVSSGNRRVTGSVAVDASHSNESKMASHRQVSVSPQGSGILPVSDAALSPRDVTLSHQSSLSRAQEWVNKSPIPQQRRFVKSKSLIDASSPTLVSKPGSSPSPLASSLTSDAMKLLHASKMPNQTCVQLPESMGPLGPAASSSPVNKAPASAKSTTSSSSPRSLSSTPEQFSPMLSSPSVQREPSPIRKSPKLRGLILRIDADVMSQASTSPSPSRTPVVNATSVMTKDTSTIISTNLPDFQVLKPRQQLQHPLAVTTALTSQAPPVSVSGSHVSAPSVSSSSSAPLSSAIVSSTSPVSMAKSLVSKVSNYSSKTAPSTLTSTYHLPSPTHARLSLVPPISHRQAVSPNPLSPSGDRFSISSGRSDSLSASNRGSLLKVPSDSSDTESIASTGPMLDDDQVEYLNMDFNEQSISVQRNEEEDLSEFMDDGPLSSMRRGHWSRMSLPPRLSYLEGYLDRARHISSQDKEDDVDRDEQYKKDIAVNENSASVGISGDQSHSSPNRLDLLDSSPTEASSNTEQVSPSSMDNSCGDDLDVTLTIDNIYFNTENDDADRNNDDTIKRKKKVSKTSDDGSENFEQDGSVSIDNEQMNAEATIVLTPDGEIGEIDNKSLNV